MKQVYSYDYNGKFIGVTEAELCQITEMKKLVQKEGEQPIESVYIVPSYSTEIAPPEFYHETHEIVFKDGEWSIIELLKKVEPIIEKEHIPDYKELRAREYPSVFEYLDGIVKKDNVQIQKYIDDCKAVKLKYPKV